MPTDDERDQREVVWLPKDDSKAAYDALVRAIGESDSRARVEQAGPMKHRWTGLGTARFTDAQAAGWSRLVGVAEDPLEMHLLRVICVVCDADFGETTEECLGPPDDQGTAHRWDVLLTIAMTDEEAENWLDPDGEQDLGNPRSINVVCVLCGEPYEHSQPTCKERAFWS